MKERILFGCVFFHHVKMIIIFAEKNYYALFIVSAR